MGPEHQRSAWPYVGGGIAAVMLFGGLMTATETLGPASIPIWFATLGAATLILRGPVGKALARRISGDLPAVTGPAELPEELYLELDDMRARMLELEERQDFSERLLASRDAPSPGP